MTATYKVDVDEELSLDVFQAIKNAFKGKTVDITITESMDETEYLLSNPANKKFLDESFAQLDAGKGIKFSIEELKEQYGVK